MTLSTQHNRRRAPKSKTGCRTCKRRKVKCDETRPSCQKCLKHGVTCDLSAGIWTTKQHELAATEPALNLGFSNQSPSWFTSTDLELLHHFTVCNCVRFSDGLLSKTFWAVEVPRMGFATSYVLHGILSLASLHVARMKPDARELYVAKAYVHHNSSLNTALPRISSLTSENSAPLLLFGIVTTIFACAQPTHPIDSFITESSVLPQWIQIFRGIRPILSFRQERLLSFFSCIFEPGVRAHDVWSSRQFENHAFQELEQNLNAKFIGNKATLSILLGSLNDLKRSFSLFYEGNYNNEYKLSGVFIWLYSIPDTYLDLLRNGNNEAMCILAFFCVLLRRLENYWWLEGWGWRLMNRILRRLDDEHGHWVNWAQEEIRWAPS
ncbi:hypothetical protein BKA67DRAFT_534779 [Truncatella angustata]|uniref:Zn(2)-C6 fungal-type domain-containing protein n=1 Tax=Truncatella angustata TaxID=152316 RepID=A0A9P8UND7_9PEZI|nr:uncharacterized protein BKA67DRAFT_534779 [Truncatella angustata]KAH6655874.1 hypothetical protein BKA67DRAFT_534779 [Truncatella angustata]